MDKNRKPNNDSHELRILERIRSIFYVHEQLQQYAAVVQVSIENTVIVLRGELPSADLKQALIPAVRQAGVLGKVQNAVHVA